jgi:hypothetical protein
MQKDAKFQKGNPLTPYLHVLRALCGEWLWLLGYVTSELNKVFPVVAQLFNGFNNIV